ncbi:hypothetical protein B0H10DRAFT_1946284 [Mycena sp. CBHHK59/15]|nr:hypothetical protein B0H10DRAFT_1946284 [Mycena sp. CBHHK59/15]
MSPLLPSPIFPKRGQCTLSLQRWTPVLATTVASNPRPKITVYTHAVMFVNHGIPKAQKCVPFSHFSTIEPLWKHLHTGSEITLGVFAMWTETPVGKPSLEWLSKHLHSCVVAIVHAPDQQQKAGKVILVGNPNIVDGDCKKTAASEILKPHLISLLRHLEKKCGGKRPIFVNTTRPERNGGGHCLQLVLEWLVEIVVNSLQIEHDAKGAVTAIEGFRQLERLVAS